MVKKEEKDEKLKKGKMMKREKRDEIMKKEEKD